ncbi:predicted protein [Lichtheimia corymbifera JMRC:FSU:9682]|uniref:Uncharacterized protein n=1 Tax=Lichtheimia corymbifera JMRC:FSU:9682 TaxID=1263082 RepID=A0A068RH47_9FUNG|nr:predicted protein [Lichtheimia corymbifera JMRC:FSU:9682]
MKRGVFNRTKLLVGVKRTLSASFTVVEAILKITQCHHQPKSILGRPLEFFFDKAGGDIAKSRIAELDRETSTQGALHPAEQLCSIEDPTFHCSIFSYGQLCVLHML